MNILNAIVELIIQVTTWIWGIPMLVIFIGGGLYFSFRLGFMQIFKLPYVVKQTFIRAIKEEPQEGRVSGFLAFKTALMSTIGMGKITGVALAIAFGGPGAIFWMWVLSLAAAIIKYSEIIMAVKYRQKDDAGNWVGGPSVYLKRIFKSKIPAVVYSCALLYTVTFSGPIQLSAAADILLVYNVPKIATVGVSLVFIAAVVFGGATRIFKVTDKLIPIISVFYIIGAVVAIAFNIDQVPAAFAAILGDAFTGTAATGGFAGASFLMAIRWGSARGAFSSDAGNGLATIAHASGYVTHPVQQGMWGIFEVTFDTILCTLSAIVFLTSGAWMAVDAGAMPVVAFSNALGPVLGGFIISMSMVLFTVKTPVAYVMIAERTLSTLGMKANKAVFVRIFYCVVLLFGGIGNLGLLIQLQDIGPAILITVNMVALFFSFGQITKFTKEYFANREVYEQGDLPEYTGEFGDLKKQAEEEQAPAGLVEE
ncbi:alanine/glycine:cation symporter family protein [Enterococcus sp. AZ109]|uniref:alanine/glycine:cation symporter family protein n=1 Tax=Enterococcus sp. AZ109 TaxID=2774634 RepID=UPI003F239E7E